MTLKQRRKIFYTLVALFIILGAGVVLYAQGWRLDFASWRLTKVGGIYVRSYPQAAAIFLDSRPIQNQSGFLSPGTLMSDLLPGTYNITLKAAGYDDWQENASVQPSLVVQYKYAVLVPQDPAPAASGTIRELLAAIPTSTAINPFKPDEKIIVSKSNATVFSVNQATTTESAIIPDATAGVPLELHWLTGSLVGILEKDGSLYLYDTNANAVTKFADDGKDFTATPDASMIAVLENHSLEVFSRADATIYYRFNLPAIATTEHIIWYRDRSHLFVVYPGYVAFLDLADGSLVNFITVAHGTSPLYDPQTNFFYVKDSSGKYVQYGFPT